MGGNARVISIRNKFTPLIDVGRELSYRTTPPIRWRASRCLLRRKAADGALSWSMPFKASARSSSEVWRPITGMSMASPRRHFGDGRVALIVDVDAVVANSHAEAAAQDNALAAVG